MKQGTKKTTGNFRANFLGKLKLCISDLFLARLLRRQCGQIVRVPDLSSGGRKFKSSSKQ